MAGIKGANVQRDREIWEARTRGVSIAELARTYGLSEVRISSIITKERGKLPRPTADEYRQAVAEQTDRMRAVLEGIIERGPAPAFSSRGDQLFAKRSDDDASPGEPVEDWGAVLGAVGQLNATNARLAKLLGLDEPEKVEAETTVKYIVDGAEDV